MRASPFARAACVLGILSIIACNAPPAPREAARAESLEQDLLRAGGSLFAAGELERFTRDMKSIRERMAAERAKFGWFRDYAPIRAELAGMIDRGEEILRSVREIKDTKSRSFQDAAEALSGRIESLRRVTSFFNEHEDIRRNMSRAEIKLHEARLLIGKELYEAASAAAATGGAFVDLAEDAAVRLLERYLDPAVQARWKRWVEQTIEESRRTGRVAMVVNKIERRITVYRRGVAVGRYEIGLGKYGLSDKIHEGDEATPEGRYKVVRKIPASRYHRALLVDYPNEEDRREYAEARKRGAVPGRAGIGGSIEIHGGGKDSLTRGCVGLENGDMDEVFRWAVVGTPVTIVGAERIENTILAEIEGFAKHG